MHSPSSLARALLLSVALGVLGPLGVSAQGGDGQEAPDSTSPEGESAPASVSEDAPAPPSGDESQGEAAASPADESPATVDPAASGEAPVAEDAIAEDAIAEDAIAEDAIAEDAIAEDAIAEDAIAEDAIAEDAIAEEPEDDFGDGAIEDFSLEDLLGMTVTATGTQMTVEEAPAIIDLVTYRDIRRRGYRTVAEALNHVVGIHMVDDHVFQLAGVRGIFSATGTPNDVIMVMINGQPVSFRPTQGNFLGHELVPIESVERIEVLRGAASALYGANAFLGVINIITFQGGDDELSRRPAHAITLDGYLMQNPYATTGNGSVSFFSSAQVERFQYMLSGVFHYADRSGLVVPGLDDLIAGSLFRLDPTTHPTPRGFPSPGWDAAGREFMQSNPISRNDEELTGSAYGMAAYRFSEETRLSLDGHFQYFDRAVEFQDFSHLTHDTRLTHLNGFGRLRLQLGSEEPGHFAAELSVAMAIGRPSRNDRIVDRFVAGSYRRRRFGNVSADFAAQGTYTFAERSSIRVGFDYAYDVQDLLTTQMVNESTGVVSDDMGFGEEVFANIGGYLQLTWNPWDRLQFTLGSRVDHSNVVACDIEVWNCIIELGDQTGPGPEGEDVLITGRGSLQLSNRAAVVYEFPWAGLYAKVIWGSSYKPPAPYQLFRRQLTITGSSVGNPALQPQTANTVEAQVGIRPLDGLHASVVAFSTWVDDAVLFLIEEGRLVGRNADMEVQGLETALRYSGNDTISLFLNATFLLNTSVRPQQRRDETDFLWEVSPFNTDVQLGRFPDIMGSGGVDLRFPDAHIGANVTFRVVGPRRASLVNNQLFNRDLDQTYRLPAYFLADLTVETIDLRWWDDRETTISVSFRGVPGGFVEAGGAGVDIPSLGSRVHLRLTQEL